MMEEVLVIKNSSGKEFPSMQYQLMILIWVMKAAWKTHRNNVLPQ